MIMSDFKIGSIEGGNNVIGDSNVVTNKNQSNSLPSLNQKLIAQKEAILKNFTKSNWIELGAILDCSDIIDGHNRLLRSLNFRDDDYEGNIINVLREVIKRNANNSALIDEFIAKKYPEHNDNSNFISTGNISNPEKKITFAPTVFSIPSNPQIHNLVSVMMPFSIGDGIYTSIKNVCTNLQVDCKRADDIWNNSVIIQDIFELIFMSKVVICDFTGKNSNVFYEAGIAHTLGKVVIPIVQHLDDVPFDLRHHRVLKYIPNTQGFEEFENELQKRLTTLGLN